MTTLDAVPGATTHRDDDRAARLVTASTVVVVIGMLFSAKIADRLAVSNVAQVLGIALLLAAYPRLVRRRDAVLILAGVASVAVASLSVSLQYGTRVLFTHSIYFLIATVYLVAVYRACREHGATDAVSEGVRRAIPVAAVVLVTMLGRDMLSGTAIPSLGFDDNSHAAVAACVLAFASLRFLRTPVRLLVALGFFALALVTYSRMPFFFMPFFVVAFVIEYRRVRARATEAWQVFGAHLILLAAVVVPVLLGVRAAHHFTVFGRVLAPGEATSASTAAHLELLALGAQLKVDSVWNLLLGVTPGGFSPAVAASSVDLSRFATMDPPAYRAIHEGTAPLHSTLGSILLEFPLWVAVLYLVVVASSVVALVRRREWVMALFLIALMVATTLYSSHNELYFVVGLAVALALAFGRPAAEVSTPSTA
jgi:hypothetical protein